jgi:hypothetical protein
MKRASDGGGGAEEKKPNHTPGFVITVRVLGGERLALNVSGIVTTSDLKVLLEKEHGLPKRLVVLYRSDAKVYGDTTFTSSCELDCVQDDVTDLPFTVSGAYDYAGGADGTYVVTTETSGGKSVFRQIENPCWKFKFCRGHPNVSQDLKQQSADPEDYAAIVTQIFQKHNPEKLENPDFIKNTLARYAGKEKDFIAALKKKYDPPPWVLAATTLPSETAKSAAKSFNTAIASYIEAVLKQVHPDATLAPKTRQLLGAVLMSFLVSILSAAKDAKGGRNGPLNTADIESGVAKVLPGELGKHGKSEMRKHLSSGKPPPPSSPSPPPVVNKLAFEPSLVPSLVGALGGADNADGAVDLNIDLNERVTVALAAVLEYVCSEVLELAGNANKDRISGFSDPDLTSAEGFEKMMAEQCPQVESEVVKKELCGLDELWDLCSNPANKESLNWLRSEAIEPQDMIAAITNDEELDALVTAMHAASTSATDTVSTGTGTGAVGADLHHAKRGASFFFLGVQSVNSILSLQG